ncbi:MAG: SIMPL domain-containing protein [Actinomycetota bacterium]|nr:SIMPL domain-containing protein [Actinomycetota bacterium]
MKQMFVTLLATLVLAGCSSADTGSTAAEPSVSPAVNATALTTAPAPPETQVPTTAGGSLETAVTVATEEPESEVATAAPAPINVTETRSITVGGVGSEYTEPERSVVDISLSSRGATVEEASRAAAASAEAIKSALTTAGVPSSGIQTSDLSIRPVYDNHPTIIGYEMRLGYRVTIHDVDTVGSLLADSIAAGGDDVRASSIRFEADPAGLMDAARTKAWIDVETRAQSLAGLANEQLGAVLDIHEKVLITSPQGMMQGGEGDSASFDIPVSPGVAGVTVLLTVTFAIGE